MVAFEEKVVSFQKENDEVQSDLVRGSDAHLDALLSIQKKIESLTHSYEDFNVEIIPDTNGLPQDEIISKAIPLLLDLYSSSIKLVATLKRSDLSRDLKCTCQGYFAQVENLRELIADLETHRANDNGLEEILQELNFF